MLASAEVQMKGRHVCTAAREQHLDALQEQGFTKLPHILQPPRAHVLSQLEAEVAGLGRALLQHLAPSQTNMIKTYDELIREVLKWSFWRRHVVKYRATCLRAWQKALNPFRLGLRVASARAAQCHH